MKVSIASLGKFHSFDLAEDMRQRGHLHRLYTGYPKSKLPEALRPYAKTCPWLTVPMMLAGRYGLERLHRWLNVPATILFDKWLTRVLEPADVFHCWASYGLEATKRAKQMGMKTVCDRGSTHIVHQNHVLRREYQRWDVPYQDPCHSRSAYFMMKREMEQYYAADVITVPSRFAASTFTEQRLHASVVPYGVSLENFKPMQKEDTTFRVLYVGALSLRKGIPYLMRAWHKASMSRWELWLVGTPLKETEGFVKGLKNLGVKVWGAVPQHQLPWFYSQASVVVMPSIEEGLALVLGQALACGTPVIATKESGVEELITDGVEGFVVKARDPQDIAKYLSRLSMYPDELEWMRKQIANRRGDWHWRNYGSRMLEVYHAT